MGSDERNVDVSLIVRDIVTRQCPQTTAFLKRKESRSEIEQRPFCLPAQRLTARPNRLTWGVSGGRGGGREGGMLLMNTFKRDFL